MRKHIGSKFRFSLDFWAKENEHYCRLAELDALLDGEFYDCLRYPFYQETVGNGARGKYIPVRDRRPSFQFNLFNMVADQVARKIFSGRHAPALVHPKKSVKEAIEAIKEECNLESKMIEATHWGSIGSVCTLFQIVAFKDTAGRARSKVIVKNIRAKYCTPTFNKLDELSRLRVHYPVKGADFMSAEVPISKDFEGNDLKGEESYWLVQDFTEKEEILYQPIPLDKWEPQQVFSEALKTPLEKTEHNLGFVPAHWHQYRTGKIKSYDGRCYWEPAIPNILDLDYTVSQIGSGVRYNSVPQVVIKGDFVGEGDAGLGRGAARFIQLKADKKEGDEETTGHSADMLEAKGDGMKVGLQDWATLTLRLAMQQICSSMKDPNKVTTAMSGKGMEIIESEFHDLAQELRTVFGDNGYLKLLKKIMAACKLKNHALTADMSIEDIDGLTLGWPPLSSIGMIEFQAMAAGLTMLVEAFIMSKEEARTFGLSQIDMPTSSANKDYLPTLAGDGQAEIEPPQSPKPSSSTTDGDEKKRIALHAAKMAENAMTAVAAGPLDTKFTQ